MYDPILVPIDGAPISDRSRREAILLAQALGSRIHFLHVVDPRLLFAEVTSKADPQTLLDTWRAGGERLVAQAVAAAKAAGVGADGVVHCDPGMRICDEILAEAERSGAGLIVIGTHGRTGVGRLWLGSNAEYVLRVSPIPVLVIRMPSH